MNDQKSESRVEEPEVLPPEGEPWHARSRRAKRRVVEALGPIGAGLLIDLIDVITIGPLGLLFGMLIGGTATYVISGYFDQPVWKRFLLALAAGIYCTLPGAKRLPLATILMAMVSLWKSDKKE